MFHRSKKLVGAAISVSGVALLVCAATVQPAGAAQFPGAAFYAGTGQTGTETAVKLNSTECQTLSAPALSAANYSTADIDVYYNPDCRSGTPGTNGDAYFRLASLHTASFPYPALSYRVRS